MTTKNEVAPEQETDEKNPYDFSEEDDKEKDEVETKSDSDETPEKESDEEDESKDDSDDIDNEDAEKLSDEEKFENQRKSAQKKITEAYEERLTTEKELVQVKPERLKQLASGSDKELKIAKRLANEVWKMPLKDALAVVEETLKEKAEEEGKEYSNEDEIRQDERRKVQLEVVSADFKKEHSVINSKSKDYDKNIDEVFQRKVEILKSDEILTIDELKEIYEDAYFLATKHLSSEDKKKTIKEEERKIATAGGGNKSKSVNHKTDNNPFAGLKSTL